MPPDAGWLLASAVLVGLAFPPFHLLLPSFVGFVPFLVWLGERPAGEDGLRTARRGGFWLGVMVGAFVHPWLLGAPLLHTPLVALAFLILVLAMGGLIAGVAWATAATRRRFGVPLWVAFPVYWTAYEWLKGSLPGLAFPWMQLGDSLTGYPALIGAADLIGSRGLSLWLALANALLASSVLAWRGRRRGDRSGRPPRRSWGRALAPSLVFAGVLALPIAYSWERARGLDTRPVALVGVVQPDVPQRVKRDREAAVERAIRSTETLIEDRLGEWAGRLDLAVLPETVFPVRLEPVAAAGYPGRPDLQTWTAGLATRLRAPVVYGALGSGASDNGGLLTFNSAFLVDAGGAPVGRYDKRFLVPGVERAWIDLKWAGRPAALGGFEAGRRSAPFRIGEGAFGVMICYESIYSSIGRRYRREGADFLVNITNDAWFGGEAWWTRGGALWQHPAHLVMRAVESRIGVVRAANTGISQIVDPLGRVRRAGPLFEPYAFAAEVHTTDGITPFVRHGDVLGRTTALGAAIGLGLLGLLRDGRRAGAPSGAPRERREEALGDGPKRREVMA